MSGRRPFQDVGNKGVRDSKRKYKERKTNVPSRSQKEIDIKMMIHMPIDVTRKTELRKTLREFIFK